MSKKGMINIAGASEGRIAPVIADILREKKGQSLIVVPTLNKARMLQTDLSFFCDQLHGEEALKILVMPPEEDGMIQYETKSSDTLIHRMKVLKTVAEGEPCVVIAPVAAAMCKLPPKEIFSSNRLVIKAGDDIEIDDIRQRLSRMGYERASIIEGVGEYSIRGGIIDIFSPDSDLPYRIELFDTEVDSIRSFDLETQRSVTNLRDITLWPCSQLSREEKLFKDADERIAKAYGKAIKKASAKDDNEKQVENLKKREAKFREYISAMINLRYLEKFIGYFYEETMYLWEYMDRPTVFIDDPARILESLEVFEKELAEDLDEVIAEGRGIAEDFALISDRKDYFKLYTHSEEGKIDGYIFTPFVGTIKNAPFLTELKQINCRQMPSYSGNMEILADDIRGYLQRGYEVTLVCGSEGKGETLREFLISKNLFKGISIVNGSLTAGVEYPEIKKCWIWEGDIFGTGRYRPRRRSKGKEVIRSFSDVKEGDYVVHESHGIGKFLGIEQLIVQKVKRDYIKVKYAGTDFLYIPVEQLGILQKYVGGESVTPKLNRLSGSEWKNTKAKAAAAVSDMAEELIKISAARKHEKGYAFSTDSLWQAEFEETFPHTETYDQLKCIEEIKEDMESEVPMDRLLCGDVGFGKTEVAARALFKCVGDGKQAAVLVPTTLLANQHYYTLKDRFEKFPFKVEVLSRFRTQAQQQEIIRAVARGDVDLIIGTHRLLSDDIKFKDLGLLVIDEEQRFGVKHKEKIKNLKNNVDVLTLSATPIPRTLHMSLSGIRDMSTITEPPEDRYPVQTYVLEQDDFVVREAIEKELARGGQVYVLYNRVSSINTIAEGIRQLVPGARVAVGHGKMRENELEDIIMDFTEGRFDVLVSTTIIESGTDIPNVNTIIVYDADHFGLAQLYQIRGRVGRAGRMAFAYLMYKKDKTLTEIAVKRLRAIREFTEFGSGFKIAMKDLELRGAGNLLGAEQSGHMLSVGYEFYCKLLEQAVERLKGGDGLGTDGEPMPSADETVFNLPVPAIIPSRYIDDEVLRLQMYKKIAVVVTDEDEADVIDELTDRFGDIPRDTMNLIRVSKIRNKAGRMGIKEISQNRFQLKLSLWENVIIGEGIVPRLSEHYRGKIKFSGGNDPHMRLTVSKETGDMGYVKSILRELEDFFEIVEDRSKDIEKGEK